MSDQIKATIAEKLLAIKDQISSYSLEREDNVHGIILCALADGNALFLGPPGTAKSMTATSFCRRVTDGRIYHTLLSQYSVVEDVLGPVNVKELVDNGKYIRKKEASIAGEDVIGAFIDECYKGTAGVLNVMLNIMNERQITEEGNAKDIDLMFLVGASNEVPTEEDGLQALHDRFNMKFDVTPLEDHASFKEMLKVKTIGEKNRLGEPKTFKGDPVMISKEELLTAREEIRQIAIPDGLLKRLSDLKKSLHDVGVKPTDRVFAESINFIKAEAYLQGREEANTQDLVILKDMLWTDKEDKKKVTSQVYKIASPEESMAQETFAKAENIYERFVEAREECNKKLEGLDKQKDAKKITKALSVFKGEALETAAKLQAVQQQFGKLIKLMVNREAKEEKVDNVQELLDKVRAWMDEIYEAQN